MRTLMVVLGDANYRMRTRTRIITTTTNRDGDRD